MSDLREVTEAAKDLPQVGALAFYVFGIHVQTWVLALTAAWAIFRLGNAILDFWDKIDARREKRKEAKHEQGN